MIISLSGFAGSGKDTVAQYLVEEYGFTKVSFGAAVKDVVASVFQWDRALLEGDTQESRDWREQVDPWWSQELGMPDLTPRKALQYVGTNLFREHMHKDIWTLAMKRKLEKYAKQDQSIVISDARFINELDLLHSMGGILAQVRRSPEPLWAKDALRYMEAIHCGNPKIIHQITAELEQDPHSMLNLNIHRSEWEWLNATRFIHIDNMGSCYDLYRQVDCFMRAILAASDQVKKNMSTIAR